MPWTIKQGGGTCSVDEWAVLKKVDGSTAGCHETESDAKKQLASLYVSDKKKRSTNMGRSSLILTGESERRDLAAEAAGLEIRGGGGGGGDDSTEERFHGYAAVYNTRAAIGNPSTVGFYEQIAPGAFTKTLQEGDTRFLIDHLSHMVVSRVSAGTLDLRSDQHGLAVDSALDPALSYVNDLKANVRNKNVTGMSFGFSTVKDEWSSVRHVTSDGKTVDAELRTLLEVRLPEVSGVTFPAYTKTQAALKSVVSAMRSRVDLHGDLEALERRTEFWPELPELCGVTLTRHTVIDLGSGKPPADSDVSTQRTGEPNESLGCPECGETRGAPTSHSTDTSDKPWDAAANEKNIPDDASAATLRKVYVWVDPKNPTKSAAKGPHHFVASDGTVGGASTAACSSIIGALNGGRGGMNVPDGDRHTIYDHAARHLRDANMTPPEMKSSEPPESTRDENTTVESETVEPAASTHTVAPSIGDRMKVLATRFHLPA